MAPTFEFGQQPDTPPPDVPPPPETITDLGDLPAMQPPPESQTPLAVSEVLDICAPAARGQTFTPLAIGAGAVERAADTPQEEGPPVTDAGGQDPPTIDPPDIGGSTFPEGDEPGDGNNEETSGKVEASQTVITDPELSQKLIEAIDAAGVENVDKVLRAHARLMPPVPQGSEYAAEIAGYNDAHQKEILDEIPPLVEAANTARIPADQAAGLAAHSLDSTRYLDARGISVIAPLRRALASAAEDTGAPPPETVVTELKELVATAGDKDMTSMALTSFEAARKAGLSVEDSAALVRDYIDTGDRHRLVYNMWKFEAALETLNVGGASPEAVKTVFQNMGNMHPKERDDAYDLFREALTFHAPAHDITASEFTESVAAQVNNGVDIREAITRAVGAGNQPTTGPELPSPTVIVPREVLERRFVEKPGPLEHAALSYQTERSLNDGVGDLAGLTDADRNRGEKIAEGLWVYDPNQSKWYSLGGETEIIPGEVRHTHIPFDISQLSDKPHQFHIHPKQAGMLADRYSFVFPTSADYRAVAEQLDNARLPADLRSFISHPMGITEFTFPAGNRDAIRQVAEGMDGLRNALWRSISTDEHEIMDIARQMGEQEFTTACVRAMNRNLPPGFEIRWHPRGVDLEQAIRRRR